MPITVQQEMEEYKSRRTTWKGKQIENWRLPDGSVYYLYCRWCGCLTDCVPDSFQGVPCLCCAPCASLAERGLFN